jgi:hypothetical protein
MPNTLDYNRRFAGLELTTSNQTLFTLPQGVLRNLVATVSNKTGSPATVTVYLVPSGGTAGADGTNIYTDYSIPANDYRELSIPKMIANDFLVATASVDNALEIFEGNGVVVV